MDWRILLSSDLQFSSTNQSLKLVISRHSETQPLNLSFSICAEFHDSISLWSSNYSRLRSSNATDASARFLHDIICGVLQYGPYSNRRSLVRLPSVQIPEDSSGKIFNIAALTLAILVSIYEAPSSLRREFIDTISAQLMRRDMGDAAKKLMLTLGSNVEEQWMLSVNLASPTGPWSVSGPVYLRRLPRCSPTLFQRPSCGRSRCTALLCHGHGASFTSDERREAAVLADTYQQLESVIQLVCQRFGKENWIDVSVNVDNIRCDVVQLVSESLMRGRVLGRMLGKTESCGSRCGRGAACVRVCWCDEYAPVTAPGLTMRCMRLGTGEMMPGQGWGEVA
ncbi:hypothetical protein EJB05_13390 [Eragrostis curvula]|uniref:Uncharacterized protein n=1 Tax=Eragrostis curvula TaxID=38414 RepID=A0A5J9VWD6_9POAL|nr:hypothetical protein EJB05_13390 [Eragrostis curvula]